LLVGIALVGYVFKKSHKILREGIEEEAEGAREVLMPGANGVGGQNYGTIGAGGASASGAGEERGRRQ